MAKAEGKKKTPKQKTKLVFSIIGWIILLTIFVASSINLFVDSYVPSFFGFRIFNVVTDSMSGTINEGSMIFDKPVNSVEEIQTGDIITYKASAGGQDIAITHRVEKIEQKDGKTIFRTKGDNAEGSDPYYVTIDDVLGKFTGFQIPIIGYLFAFLASTQGIITLAAIMFIIILSSAILGALKLSDRHESTFFRAIAKGYSTLNAAQGTAAVNDSAQEAVYVMSLIAGGNHKDNKLNKARDEVIEKYVQGDNLEKIEYEVLLNSNNVSVEGAALSKDDAEAFKEFSQASVGAKEAPKKIDGIFKKNKKLTEKEKNLIKTYIKDKDDKNRQSAIGKHLIILNEYDRLYELKKNIFEKKSAVDEYEKSINWINLGIAKANTELELDALKEKLVKLSESSLSYVAAMSDLKFEHDKYEENINLHIFELDQYINENNVSKIREDIVKERKEKVNDLSRKYEKYTKHYIHGITTKQLLQDVDNQKIKLKAQAERDRKEKEKTYIVEKTALINQFMQEAIDCDKLSDVDHVASKVSEFESLQKNQPQYAVITEKLTELKTFVKQKSEQVKVFEENKNKQDAILQEQSFQEIEKLCEQYGCVSGDMCELEKRAYSLDYSLKKNQDELNVLTAELSKSDNQSSASDISQAIAQKNTVISNLQNELKAADLDISKLQHKCDELMSQVNNTLKRHNFAEVSISAKYEIELLNKDLQTDFDKFVLQHKEEQGRLEAKEQQDVLKMQAEKAQLDAEQIKLYAMQEIEKMRALLYDKTAELQKATEEKAKEAQIAAQKQVENIRKQMQKNVEETNKKAVEKVIVTKVQILKNVLRDIRQAANEAGLNISINDLKNVKVDLKPEYVTADIRKIIQECEMSISLKRAELKKQNEKNLKILKVIQELNGKISECKAAIPTITSSDEARALADELAEFEDNVDAELKTEKIIFAVSKCKDAILHAGQIADLKNRKRTKKVIHKRVSVKKKAPPKRTKEAAAIKKKKKVS